MTLKIVFETTISLSLYAALDFLLYIYFNGDRKTVKEVFPEEIVKEEQVGGEGALMIGEYILY